MTLLQFLVLAIVVFGFAVPLACVIAHTFKEKSDEKDVDARFFIKF